MSNEFLRYYTEEELQEWFDMWDEQLYYEENICSLNNKQEGYDYGSDETNKFSQEDTKNFATVEECGNEDGDGKCMV